jgi:hypothetical protein
MVSSFVAPRSQFPMPENLSPDKVRCVTFYLPDDPEWYSVFWGTLYEMTYKKKWDTRSVTDAGLVANRWLAVWEAARDNFISQLCAQSGLLGSGCAEEDGCMCCLRVENGKLQQLVCGVWTDVPGQGPGGIGGGQPGENPGQPASGACQSLHAQVNYGHSWLLPAPINAGDVLTITGANGAWTNDGDLGVWRCPDGNIYFGGVCIDGTTVTGGGYPSVDATKPYECLLGFDGTNYYDLSAAASVGGSVIVTIPGGVANAQFTFLANRSTPSGSGSVQFSLDFCNNQSSGVNQNNNFRINSYSWVPLVQNPSLVSGVWVPGQGFKDTLGNIGSVQYRAAGCMITLPSFTLTDFVVRYNLTQAGEFTPTQPGIYLIYNHTNVLGTPINWNARSDGNDQVIEFHGSQAGVTQIGVFVGAGNDPSVDPGGSALITSALVQGH